jgi:hypothetical protein
LQIFHGRTSALWHPYVEINIFLHGLTHDTLR